MKCGLIQPLLSLREIQLARRNQHLAHLAFDGVAIDIGLRIGVRPVGLQLRERVVKSVPVPQAHVVEQRFVLGEIDFLFGLGLEIDLVGALVDAVGGARGGDVAFDKRALERDFVGANISGRYDGRNHVAHNERQHHQQCQAPFIGEQRNGRKHAAYDEKP